MIELDQKNIWLVKNFRDLLDDLERVFLEFLEMKFDLLYGNSYLFIIKSKYKKKHVPNWESLGNLDFYDLIKIFDKFHYDFLDKNLVESNSRNVVNSMRDVRHDVSGHKEIEGPTYNQLEDFIIRTINFARLINSNEQTIKNLESLKNQVNIQNLISQGLIPELGFSIGSGSLETNNIVSVSMSMQDIINQRKYSQSQESALQKLENFIKDDEQQCFILKGYAGTGKTFIIGSLIDYLNSNHRQSKIMAPTGRAARLLTEKHKVSATTIHKSIYYVKELKEYKDSDNGKVTYKYYFDLLNNDSDHGTIFIIDEASMISDYYSEQEFIRFGSGKLLNDLLRYVGFDNNDNRKKVIFVGDFAQLPPVDMNFSPALDEIYMKENYGLNIQIAELTDVFRQQKNSLVLNNATNIRAMITNETYNNFIIEEDKEHVNILNQIEVIPDFLESYKNSKTESIIVTYSNALAGSYNKTIREHLFPNENEICIGDRIIAIRNNYSFPIEIMNGQIGFIIDVNPFSKEEHVPLNLGKNNKGEIERISVKLSFKEVKISFEDINKNEHIISARILENVLYSDKGSLNPIASKALYVHFTRRNPKLKPGSEEFKRAISSDPYFNALQIRFAYAITCHKAQGGEWENVFVDFEGRNSLNKSSLRWIYTAITRSSSKLKVCNPIHQKLLTPIKMSHNDLFNIEDDETKENTIITNQTFSSDDILSEPVFKDISEISKQIYLLMKPYLPNKLILQKIEEKQYQTNYNVNFENNRFKILVNYKKNHLLSRIQFSKKVNNFSNIEIALKENVQGQLIQSKVTMIDKNENIATNDINHNFFSQVEQLYIENDIQFKLVKQSNYHYKIEIISDESSDKYNFFFDGQNRFTKITTQNDNPNKRLFNKILKLHLEV